MDDQYAKASVDSLIFVPKSHTLQTYLGIKLIEKILITHSLAGKTMLLIKHIKCLFRVVVQLHGVLIRRNMVHCLIRDMLFYIRHSVYMDHVVYMEYAFYL